MAHLHRLIRLLAIAVLTVVSAFAQAQQQTSYPATLVYRVSDRSFTDVNEYCRFRWDAMAYEGYTYVGPRPMPDRDNYFYCVDKQDSSGRLRDFTSAFPEYLCKSGGSLQGRICLKTCPEGQELQPDGACKLKENKCPAAGTPTGKNAVNGSGNFTAWRNPNIKERIERSGGSTCYGGCNVTGDKTVCIPPDGSGDFNCVVFGTRYTGETCTGDGDVVPIGGELGSEPDKPLPNEDPRKKCLDKGMSFGEANGKIICVPKSGGGNQGGGNQGGGNQGGGNQGGGNQGGGNQGGGDSGGGTGGGNSGGGNGSGNGSGDGNGSGNGSGGGGAGNNNKNDMEDFCAKHPDLSICKKSSYSGSGCDQPPKCEGDAVQCAIAKTVWESRCAQKKLEDENDLQKLVDANNLGGNQAIADKALNKNGDGDFDLYKEFISSQKDYFHYSGTCPQNPEFTFKGQTYKLDISVLCTLGRFIKVLIYIFSYMPVLKLFARLGD